MTEKFSVTGKGVGLEAFMQNDIPVVVIKYLSNVNTESAVESIQLLWDYTQNPENPKSFCLIGDLTGVATIQLPDLSKLVSEYRQKSSLSALKRIIIVGQKSYLLEMITRLLGAAVRKMEFANTMDEALAMAPNSVLNRFGIK